MMRRSLAEPRAGRGVARGPLASPWLLAAALGACALLGGSARGQGVAPSLTPPGQPAATDPVVARVDGAPIRRSEIESRKSRAVAGYTRETGREVPPAFTGFFMRAALEEAIRERLLAREGRARGVVVSDAAADSVLQQDALFRPAGKYDPARFEKYRRENPKSFAQVREEARDFLAFQRHARALERELEPDAATLDRQVAQRTEKVDVRWALVAETQFDGRTDPDDATLRAYYAQNHDAFAPPGRAAFTLLIVPGLEEGRPAVAALDRARRAADGLIAEIRRGLPFDSAAARPGLLHGTGTWGQGQEQGIFADQAAWAESAFAAAPGHVLGRPFEVPEGWALVRIDRATPRTAPPLADVAADVRARWRAEQLAARERADARRFYETHPDSFRAATWLVRWATVDTGRLPLPRAKDAELRAWFDRHASEFARLDPGGGGIRRLSFEEARVEVEARWATEQRSAAARALADRVAAAWARGGNGPGREAALETAGPVALVPGGALPPGLRADLADSALSWERGPRALVDTDPRGFAIVGLVRREEGQRAPFEVVEPRVREAVARERLAAERAAAQAWYEANPGRYQTGPGYAVVYALSPRPLPARVDVPGAAVERYYREHPGEFTPPEEVQVRHILFSTAARSVAEATRLAREARGRIARGEDFATIARQLSEDPASRDKGGDLGWIRRGMTVPAFEKAAFALTAGAPYSTPVETSYGVHLLAFVDRRGGRTEPYEAVRPRIVSRLVEQYADTLARHGAEAFLAGAPSRETFVTRAEAAKLPTARITWYEGFALAGPAMIDALRADAAQAQPGEILPGTYRFLDQGYVVALLDSLLPSQPLLFAENESRVVEDFRRQARIAAARERAARVEADLAAGRSWSEATETIGGSSAPFRLGYGDPLPGFGALPAIDSVLFGPDAPPAGGLRRIETPRGTLLLSVAERIPADADVRARERATVRNAVLNRRLYDHVEALRERARIEILRADLAERPPAPPRL